MLDIKCPRRLTDTITPTTPQITDICGKREKTILENLIIIKPMSRSDHQAQMCGVASV